MKVQTETVTCSECSTVHFQIVRWHRTNTPQCKHCKTDLPVVGTLQDMPINQSLADLYWDTNRYAFGGAVKLPLPWPGARIAIVNNHIVKFQSTFRKYLPSSDMADQAAKQLWLNLVTENAK